MLLMGKSTISMVMFNSYVTNLPEGTHLNPPTPMCATVKSTMRSFSGWWLQTVFTHLNSMKSASSDG